VSAVYGGKRVGVYQPATAYCHCLLPLLLPFRAIRSFSSRRSRLPFRAIRLLYKHTACRVPY